MWRPSTETSKRRARRPRIAAATPVIPGHDAVDANGRYYEIKTAARVSSSGKRKTSLGVTTEHTLTKANIERYRHAFLWIVAVFDQSHPEAIYEITPQTLEPYFATWEAKLDQQQAVRAEGGAPVHLNNPKIPLKFVALSRPRFVGGYDALASGLIIVWSCPISQSFSYSAGGIFPQAEWSLSLLYQDTHSAVATVTSPASCHGPSRLISSFLYREFTASAAALS